MVNTNQIILEKKKVEGGENSDQKSVLKNYISSAATRIFFLIQIGKL